MSVPYDHHLLTRLLTDGGKIDPNWLLNLLTEAGPSSAGRVFNLNTVDVTVSHSRNVVVVEDIFDEASQTELPAATLESMLTNLSGPLRPLVDRVEADFGPTPMKPSNDAAAALVLLAQIHPDDPYRLAAAALLAADGNLQELKTQVQLSHTDWRDLLVNGGLEDADWRTTLQRLWPPSPEVKTTDHRRSWPDRVKRRFLGQRTAR